LSPGRPPSRLKPSFSTELVILLFPPLSSSFCSRVQFAPYLPSCTSCSVSGSVCFFPSLRFPLAIETRRPALGVSGAGLWGAFQLCFDLLFMLYSHYCLKVILLPPVRPFTRSKVFFLPAPFVLSLARSSPSFCFPALKVRAVFFFFLTIVGNSSNPRPLFSSFRRLLALGFFRCGLGSQVLRLSLPFRFSFFFLFMRRAVPSGFSFPSDLFLHSVSCAHVAFPFYSFFSCPNSFPPQPAFLFYLALNSPPL